MIKYFFWNQWDRSNKILYTFLLIVFLLVFANFLWAYLQGENQVIQWEVGSDIETVKTVFDKYQVGLYEFPIEVENYLLLQHFFPSNLLIKEWPSIPLLCCLAIALITLMAIATTLKKIWYVVSMVLFALALVGLKFEFLELFGRYDKFGVLVAFVLFFSLSYYFQFFRRSSTFAVRWLAFLAAAIVFAVLLFWSAHVEQPALQLANYGLYVPVVLSVLFIFLIGHEPVAAFLHVTTQSGFKSKGSNLFHFLVISLFYLINVIIVYLRNSKFVEINIYTINSYWLLVIATILGIWGYKRREPTYVKMYPFRVSGAYLYVALAITTFSTITYLIQSSNDSLLETMEDAIVFSQIGHGFMFIIYVITNFYTLLYKNVPISKIVYKPPRMPFFISRFAGIIVILGLFFRGNLIPFYQAIAGYNTGIGDIYYSQEDFLAAKAYYDKANDFSATSHRANYALASIADQNNDPSGALMYLLQSVIKNPTAYAYARIARQYELRDRYFDAVFTLREATEKFPDSGPLANNMGLLYSKTAITDSTLYFLNRAARHHLSENISRSNQIALAAFKALPLEEEILEGWLQVSDHLPTINNQLVLAKLYGRAIPPHPQLLFEVGMKNETEQLIYNYNKLILDPEPGDSTFRSRKQEYYRQSEHPWMEEQLEAALGFSSFSQGSVTDAFNTFNYLLNLQNSRWPFYGKILGRLSLKKDAPRLARDYLSSVYRMGDPSTAPELGLAAMAAGDMNLATSIFNDIRRQPDSTYHALSLEMLNILREKNPRSMLLKSPGDIYHFIRFRFEDFDDSVMEGLVLSMENQNYQQLAYLDILNLKLQTRQIGHASQIVHRLSETELDNPVIKRRYNNAMIRFYVITNDLSNLKTFMNRIPTADIHPTLHKLGSALIAGFDGSRDQSLKDLRSVGFLDPFIEETALEAAKQFNLNKTDVQTAYDILLNAVNINPYSQNIQEAYIMQCLIVGLDNYATDALEDYKAKVPAETFNAFYNVYVKAKKEYAAAQKEWE